MDQHWNWQVRTILTLKTLQTLYVISNLTRTLHLDLLTRMPFVDVNLPSSSTTKRKKCGKSQQNKTQTLPIYQASKEWKLGKINLEMGTPEECNYMRASTPNSWSINHQHSPSLEESKSLHKYDNFGELPQTLIGISQSQTKCPNP